MTQYDHDKILSHWDDSQVESMYDKVLLSDELNLINKYINIGDKVLDAGCGEGEGTKNYSLIPDVRVHAVDFSDTRLEKAKERLSNMSNVTLEKVDFTGEYIIDNDYDVVVSQRFLINITNWDLQKKIISGLMSALRDGGRLVMLEGCVDGVSLLNSLRGYLKLPPIPIPWHNLFFEEKSLIKFMNKNNWSLVDSDGLGSYFFLTRGIRPFFEKELSWDCDFNKLASSEDISDLLGLGSRMSRIKLWVFEKQ